MRRLKETKIIENKQLIIQAAEEMQMELRKAGFDNSLGEVGKDYAEIILQNSTRLGKVFSDILRKFYSIRGMDTISVSWDQDNDSKAIYLTL